MLSMATRFTTHSPSSPSSSPSSYIHNCQVKHSTTPAVLLSSFSGRKPPYNTLVFQAVRLLGPPARFEASKLEVLLKGEEVDTYSSIVPRTYTLSHCDFTANLTLTISNNIQYNQVVSFADLNILPTYYAIKSTSKVGNSNAEQVFDEMPLVEDSPFSSANGVVMSMEGYAATTEAHSLQWCLSFHAFHAIPTMKFGVNQVAAIADKSLLFTLEFEEAFNLTSSIFRPYDHSTLAYHCIHKSKAMALISHTSSDAHDNAFTELFVVAYAMV
ncbi:hypothetical protein MTR67_019915 [Solanum verrucosum]|uniref:Staygreen protein domain-containing protein n=1 Tax=Solanum verrucosum TaxID=315347 RepID=A0AAF0TUD7_SOLVR|nr:hypothetical protein MTR67_019915 [Solanum verrucosum]